MEINAVLLEGGHAFSDRVNQQEYLLAVSPVCAMKLLRPSSAARYLFLVEMPQTIPASIRRQTPPFC